MSKNADNNILNQRYRLDAQHGSGGMSVIYKATDLLLGRQVAVKILRPSLTNDPVFLARFRQEARNVANLQHPNIVTVYDVGQDGNTHYIVMELVDGEDLKKYIRANAPLPIDRVLDIAIKICGGIGYAHRAGLVHADVKPQNILMSANDVKVTDFGIAQALSASDPNERQKVVWGSPHYFSPEQAQGRNPTTASDVYSIGVVMFEMLTGSLPFSGADQQELALAHVRQPAPHLHEFNPNLPEGLDRIIQKVLSKEPSARYRMADQLGRILVNYRDQGLGKTSGGGFPEVIPTRIGDPSPYAPPPANAPYVPPSAAATLMNIPSPALSAQTMVSAGVSRPMEGLEVPLNQPTFPSHLRESGYYTPLDPPELDSVSLLLGFIAFLAVLGMVILWVFVFQAYY